MMLAPLSAPETLSVPVTELLPVIAAPPVATVKPPVMVAPPLVAVRIAAETKPVTPIDPVRFTPLGVT